MAMEPKMYQRSRNDAIFLSNLFAKLHDKAKGPKRSDTAAVLSRRVELRQGTTAETSRRYLVTFRLTDGTEQELVAEQALFHQLNEEQSGELTWQGNLLLNFEAK